MAYRIIRANGQVLAASPLYGLTTDPNYYLMLADGTDAAAVVAKALDRRPGLNLDGWETENFSPE